MSHRIVLISGATGQQGGATARALAGKGFTIRALTRKPESDKAKALGIPVYEMFGGPLDQSRPWDTTAVVGMYRLLQRIWRVIVDEDESPKKSFSLSPLTRSPHNNSCPTTYPAANASPTIVSRTAAATANTLSRSPTFVIVRPVPPL